MKYNKDDLVGELVTDSEGKAVLNNLPIGKYYLVEEKPDRTASSIRRRSFEIKYDGQETAVDYVTMGLTMRDSIFL